MNFEDLQSRPRVAYAPLSTSTEELAALVVPPALLAFLDDGPQFRPRLPRSPRSQAIEQLTAVVAASPRGLPYDSSQSRPLVSYAPRPETVEVLLAQAQPSLLPWGDLLNSPAVVSRYSIITPEQEDAAELGGLVVAPFASLETWEGSCLLSRWRPRRIASSNDNPAILSGLPPALPYFDMAEPARRFAVDRPLLACIRTNTEVLPRFISIAVPYIPSGEQFFGASFLRRPEQILSMLPPGAAAPLLYLGASRWILAPLPDRDPRSRALAALQRFVSLLTFRRTIAPGEAEGRAFRLDLERQIFTDMPDDVVDADLPTVSFLPLSTGVHDSLGMGGVSFLEETYGLYGPGSVVVRYGEYIESFTIEVLAAKPAHRRALVAGLQVALRLNETSKTLRLLLPDYFDSVADFALTDTQYIEDPYAVQNRRRAHLHVTMTVPDLWVVYGVPELRPSVLLEIGAEIQLELRSSLAQLAPHLSAEEIARLTRRY